MHLGAVSFGQTTQHRGVEAVAAQQDYLPRAVLEAVLRIAQTNGSGAAGDHHVLQRGDI